MRRIAQRAAVGCKRTGRAEASHRRRPLNNPNQLSGWLLAFGTLLFLFDGAEVAVNVACLHELHIGIEHGEFVAHIGRCQEAYVYAADILGHKVCAVQCAFGFDGGAEGAEVAKAHAGSIAEVVHNLLFKGREHGLHIVDSDGTLLGDDGGKLLTLDGNRTNQPSIELYGLVDGALASENIVLQQSFFCF